MDSTIDRRSFLRMAGSAAVTLAGGGVLAACSSRDGVRDTVEVLQIGGPLKRHWCEDADQFLVATDFLPVPKRGNRMVFFLIRDSGGALVLSGLRTSFTIANGHVVDDELSERAGIAGMSEDELVALLRLAESEP